MSRERCFKEADAVSHPVGLSDKSRGLVLPNTNQGTEVSLLVYETIHRSRRRGVADEGFGELPLLHLPETTERLSLGATSTRTYSRLLAPELYTRLLVRAKSILFR